MGQSQRLVPGRRVCSTAGRASGFVKFPGRAVVRGNIGTPLGFFAGLSYCGTAGGLSLYEHYPAGKQ